MARNLYWLCMTIFLASFCGNLAATYAQEPSEEHPAFGAIHTTELKVESTVVDIPKLEAKAVDILRTKYGLTLAEARDKVRIDGKTDVARCLEYLYINAVTSVVQARVEVTVVAEQHP